MSTDASDYEMQLRKDEGQKEIQSRPALSAGKIFYKPGAIEEETDETSCLDSSVMESPMLGLGYDGGLLRPPMIRQSSSLHRVPTYSSSIGHSTVYRHETCSGQWLVILRDDRDLWLVVNMSSKQPRAASRRRLPKGPSQGQPQGPSQGQPKGPSQGHSRDASASEASRAPSAATLHSVGQTTDYSDTESVMSVSDCGSIRRESRKRFLRQKSGGSPDAARTPAKRAIIEADLEEVVASKEKVARTTRAKAGYGAVTVRYGDHSVEEMERMALEDQGEIIEVASKSSNLKGTFQKALKCRAASLMGIVRELSQRTTSNETRLLQAKVDRLQKEMSALHARIAELMARSEGTSEGPAVAAAPSNLEDIIRKVVMEERAFTKACFAGIEDRLLPEKRLRPPLDRTSTAPPPQEAAPAQKEQPKATKAGKGKGKGKKSPSAPTSQAGASAAPAPAQALVREDALLPSTTPSNEPWKKVVGKKQRKGKKPVPESLAANKAPAGKRRKLAPPKTAAVVVTLTAEAVTRGETYESVLRRARANIDPVQPGSRDRDIIACDASGFTRAPGDEDADDPLLVKRAHDMHADPESPSREEAQLLTDDWYKVKPVSGNGNLSPGVYYPSGSKRSRSHRHGASRRTRRRAILKNGECNILKSKISQRRLRFLQDMFTTLVDAQWRWTLLIFTLSFILSWLGFALIWWLIAVTHGDLEPEHLPPMQESSNWKPCVFNIYDFTSCFLFSIETQHTIGYGSRTTTEECPEAIFIMCLQSIVGVMIQAFMVGIVFAKMTRPKHRTQTLLFSRYAVVCQRDGELCLMFRVGDLRKSHIIGASVRAQLIRTRTTKEGEVLSHYQTELELNADGCDSNLFFIWPITMVHRINASSPFYGVSAADVLQEKFEIVVILEGTIESTGQTTQARSSYTTSEIMWGHRFVPLVSYNRERQGYEVDYSKFEETSQVDTPLCSAKELDEFYGTQAERRSIESTEPMVLRLPERHDPEPVPKAEHKNGDFTVTL
ncbi:unnamed protein product [Danaus chrysippus]|uniref:(African queen) hypothetical protein n=1 Tax=Danaus chrysippus TaxID=151541 RepID=A0A8J2VX49_9NEOP|nr:unnamed protein product [Danaus chrysippus]